MSQNLPGDHDARMARALLALDGLSVGDAFGQCFFLAGAESLIAARAWPAEPWYYTDDTAMALSIVEVLGRSGEIERDELARRFAARYVDEPRRGYGGTAHGILTNIAQGLRWEQAAGEVFDGDGSMGNGGGMRAAPVGAYFADDLEAVVVNARRSAEVTHAHPDGQAGAIAVAVAAAEAVRIGQLEGPIPRDAGDALLARALEHTPEGPTYAVLERALALPRSYSVETAVAALGNGSRVISLDTVPFALWCAARHLDNFEEALWTTVRGLGDRDTTCAMVGGIVALAVGREGIPRRFLEAREDFKVDLAGAENR